MDISIIVCTYNRCERLRNVLRDLNNLTIPRGTSCEVLIIDNNSNDGTRAVVETLAATRPELFKYVFEPRQGKSYALNKGLLLARGEIIAFTDDDVMVDSRWIGEIKRGFDSYDCMGIGGKILPVWNCDKPGWFEEEGPYGLYAAIVKLDLGNEVSELKIPAFGANMAFRRSVIKKYGLFREDLGPNPGNLIRDEDTEFFSRVIRGGEKCMYIPTAIVYHPVEQKRIEKAYFKRWYFDYGRAAARQQSVPEQTKCFADIPAYLIRMLFELTLKWLFSVNRKRRFFYKLQAYQSAGQIRELYKRSKSS